MSVVLNEIKGSLKQDTIIVSIAAGVPLAAMKVIPMTVPLRAITPVEPIYRSFMSRLIVQEATGPGTKLIRVMPNTPCLVGETASAMCLGGTATEDDAEIVRTLFSAVGTIFKV